MEISHQFSASSKISSANLSLWAELTGVFFVLPIVAWYYAEVLRGIAHGGSFIMLLLPIFATMCTFYLLKLTNFDWRQFLFIGVSRSQFASLLKTFFIIATVSGVATWVFIPESLFFMPKQHTTAWLTLLIAYPLLSVIPQSIIYRVFFEHRYAPLFATSPQLIVTSAVCFGFGHVIFANWVAPVGCFVGGLLLAWRYHTTRSMLLTSFEHALYGNWLFTVGLGKYLLSGQL